MHDPHIVAADALAMLAAERRQVAALLLDGGRSWPAYQLLALRRTEALDALGDLYAVTRDAGIAMRMDALIREQDSAAQVEAWAAECRAAGRVSS